MITVALIGPDGAGKSTVARELVDQPMPAPVRPLYMGVNLEASGLMLPTTRLALAVKRFRGRRADMVAPTAVSVATQPRRGAAADTISGAVRLVRLALWVAEEWYRQLVAWYFRARGDIVVFDRHFFADYYHRDIAGEAGGRSAAGALHGLLLRRLYPKPDLVICLDAPGQVLYERKGEATAQWLEGRRQQYLQLATVVPHFVVVDACRPLDVVVKDVADTITRFWEKRFR